MSQIRYLADNDLADAIVRGVIHLAPGAVFVRLRDLRLHQLPDAQVLEYAAQHGYVIVSHDVTTMSAAATARMQAGERMTGLFLIHQRTRFKPAIDDLVLIWSIDQAEDCENRVEYLPL